MTAPRRRSYHRRARAHEGGSTPRTEARTSVVDLAAARDGRRLRDTHDRLCAVAETNRRALSRLFGSGLIFSRAGARLGRDLLLAHQHLLRVKDLLRRVGDLGGAGAGRGAEAEAIYAQVHALLLRTSELSARSEGLLARR